MNVPACVYPFQIAFFVFFFFVSENGKEMNNKTIELVYILSIIQKSNSMKLLNARNGVLKTCTETPNRIHLNEEDP